MPSGYILPDGSFKEHIDYPDIIVKPIFADSPCGNAATLLAEQQAKTAPPDSTDKSN